MSTDRDVNRIVRSWLEEGRTALPDRVLDAVLDQLPATPQRRALGPARRIADMNNIVRIAVAAAAVVLATVGGVNLIMRAQQGGSDTGSQTSRPTSSAQIAVPQTIYGTTKLDPGIYTIGRWFPVQFQITVPGGWETFDTTPAIVRIWKPGQPRDTHSAILTFEIVRGVYSALCQGTYMQIGDRVDDLVNALTGVAGLQAGPVTDIVIDGRAGKAFDLAESTDLTCPSGTDTYQWTSDGPVGFGNAHQRVIVLDVGGQRLVLDAMTYVDASRTADAAQMDAIINSIKFQP